MMKLELILDDIQTYDGDTVADILHAEIKEVITAAVRKAIKQQEAQLTALCNHAVKELLTPEMVAAVLKVLRTT